MAVIVELLMNRYLQSMSEELPCSCCVPLYKYRVRESLGHDCVGHVSPPVEPPTPYSAAPGFQRAGSWRRRRRTSGPNFAVRWEMLPVKEREAKETYRKHSPEERHDERPDAQRLRPLRVTGAQRSDSIRPPPPPNLPHCPVSVPRLIQPLTIHSRPLPLSLPCFSDLVTFPAQYLPSLPSFSICLPLAVISSMSVLISK